MTPCPSRADLLDLLAERIPEEQESTLLAHIETCPVCQVLLEELTAPFAHDPRSGDGEPSREPPFRTDPFWRGLKAAVPGPGSTLRPGPADSLVGERQNGTATAPLPERLGRYELLEEIGRGGMGCVMRGHDPELGRDLAVKILLPDHQDDPAVVSRFTEEAQIGGQLQHPGIVPVYEAGRSADHLPYFTMKLVRGRTLAELLSQRADPRQDLPRFLLVFEQVCQTVAYAHHRGVIHRDLKPANVMVGAFGEVQVMDWGLAKVLPHDGGTPSVPGWCAASTRGLATALDPEGGVSPQSQPQLPGEIADTVRTLRSAGTELVSEPGQVLGTPAYMAPEQAAGKPDQLDERCDVFGLGAILCEILTGQPPYSGADGLPALYKALSADLDEAFARLEACGADPDLIRLARNSLAAEVSARPRDAGVLADELAAHRESMEARLRQAELAQAQAQTRAQEERKRRRVTIALAGSVLLIVFLVAGGLLLAAWERQGREAQARDALTQARAARQRWQAGNDPAHWAEARALALRAEALLGQGSSELAEPARELLRVLDEELADREMVHRLREAIFRGMRLKDVVADNGPIVRAYEEAFRRYGIPVQHLPLEEAARRLRARAIRGELASALDNWARLKRKASERKHLQDLAFAVEDDGWRNAIRQARVQKNRDALRNLLSKQGADLPPATLFLVGGALRSEEAETLLLQAREQSPGAFWVNYYIGTNYGERDPPQHVEAVRFLTAAVAVRSDSPVAQATLGEYLGTLGRLKEAQAHLEKALLLEANYPEAHALLGTVLQKMGKLEEAMAAYGEAIRLDPDLAFAHCHLGFAWSEKGETGMAMACYEVALRLQKDYALAHYGLGNLWSAQRQYDAAIASYKEALRCRSSFAEAQNNLGLALRDSGRSSQALAAFRKAITLNPALAQAHHNLGEAMREEGRLDEAIDAFRQAARLQADDPDRYMELGVTLARRRRLHEAADAFREATRLKKDYARAHSNLGTALYMLGELDRAIASCREAIRLDPTLAGAHNTLGMALARKGDLDGAIASYRQAVGFNKDYPEALANLGDALTRKGLLDEAVASLRRAIRLRPSDAPAHCNLGFALRDQGRFAEALASLRRGHALGSREAGWSHPSADWVRQAERLVELERRLPAVFDGKDKPANAAEQIEFAWICTVQRYYAGAARLYAEGFAVRGKEREERHALYRYFAACSAAMAGCGQGEGAASLNEAERARWRKQAQEWLRAELALLAQRLDSGKPADRTAVRQALEHWPADPRLAGVRGTEAIDQLPAEEREGWGKIWIEVEALRRNAQEKTR
jgi:serine/threonine-protein kinase